jgi:hypothetical protein
MLDKCFFNILKSICVILIIKILRSRGNRNDILREAITIYVFKNRMMSNECVEIYKYI